MYIYSVIKTNVTSFQESTTYVRCKNISVFVFHQSTDMNLLDLQHVSLYNSAVYIRSATFSNNFVIYKQLSQTLICTFHAIIVYSFCDP